jgi:hypothetical protein
MLSDGVNILLDLADTLSAAYSLFLVILYASMLYIHLRHYRIISAGSMPQVVWYDSSNMPTPAPELAPLNEMLRAADFRFVGVARAKYPAIAQPQDNYHYVSAAEDTYAEIVANGGGKVGLGFSTRYPDDARIMTTFPHGLVQQRETFQSAYAAHSAEAALHHHLNAVRGWTAKRGAPVPMRGTADIDLSDEAYFKNGQRDAFFRPAKRLRLISLVLFAAILLLCLLDWIFTLGTGTSPLPQALITLTLLVPVLDYLRYWRFMRQNKPLDAAMPTVSNVKAPRTGLRRAYPFLGTAFILGMVALVLWLEAEPAVLQQLFVSIHYQEGEQWVSIPSPGAEAHGLAITPDGTLWALTDSRLAYWRGEAWQTAWQATQNGRGFALDGATLWLITEGQIVRCDTTAITCAPVRDMTDALAIAAAEGRVLVISAAAQAAVFHDGDWEDFALAEALPNFDPTAAPTDSASVLISDGGRLWIEWGRVWQRKPGSDRAWQPVMFEREQQPRIDLLGVADDTLWTQWANGFSQSDLETRRWDMVDWEDLPGGDHEDWVYQMTSAPNGDVLIGAQGGVLRFNDDAWTFLPVPQSWSVKNLALAPDNTLWVQSTSSSTLPALLILSVVTVGSMALALFSLWRRLLKQR